MNTIVYTTIFTALFPFLLLIVYRNISKKNNKEKLTRSNEKTIDSKEQNFVEEYKRQIKYRINLFTYLGVIIALIGPVWFLIYQVAETNAFGKKTLGLESYTSRMNDTYLFSFLMFVACIILIIPFVLLFRSYLKQYLDVIVSLSDENLQKVKLINERLSFLDKYMPPYIIRDKTVIIFNILGSQMIFRFREINRVIVKKTIDKFGFRYMFTITTSTANEQFALNGDYFLKENLINAILKENPNVKLLDN